LFERIGVGRQRRGGNQRLLLVAEARLKRWHRTRAASPHRGFQFLPLGQAFPHGRRDFPG